MTYTKELPRIKIAFTAVALMVATLGTVGGTVSATTTSEHHAQKTSMHGHGHGHHKQHHVESQAAQDLRNGLTVLLQEHVTTNLEVNHLIAAGASSMEIETAKDAQVANSAALSGAVASIYGEAAGTAFFDLFQEHIDASNEFAVAVAAGDEGAKIAANAELEEYLVEITEFFVGAIDGLSSEAVLGLLSEHEMLINQSTEAFAEENFGQSRKFEVKATKQVAVIANALATGIISTKNL